MRFRSMFFQSVVVLMVVLIFSTGFAHAEGVSGSGYELFKNALGIGQSILGSGEENLLQWG